MIDINELHRLTQAATPGPWKMLPIGYGRQKFAVADSEFLSILTVTDEGEATFGTVYDDADAKFIAAANPAAISELLDRLEEARTAWKEADKACRDLTEKVIPNLRESLEAAEKERDALQAKLEEVERQEPVAWMSSRNGFICKENKNPEYNVPLKRFDLGAQGEEK